MAENIGHSMSQAVSRGPSPRRTRFEPSSIDERFVMEDYAVLKEFFSQILLNTNKNM